MILVSNYNNYSFLFFNGEYYFLLEKEWLIDKKWNVFPSEDKDFVVNIPAVLDQETQKIYKKKTLSKREIDEQIKIAVEKFPELLI